MGGALHNCLEKLINLHVLVSRALAVIGAQVHASQHHLGHTGLLGLAHLLEHGLDGHGALGTARLPHDAIRAAVIAAVLDLHAQTRASQSIDHIAVAAGGHTIGFDTQHLANTIGDVDFRRLGNHALRKLYKLFGMQVDDAAGHDHVGLAWI